jgi:hypothetical protein
VVRWVLTLSPTEFRFARSRWSCEAVKDEDREKKLRALRTLLKGLPADETAMFMDEVDVNLNPKVGCMWMRRGQQAAVETRATTRSGTSPGASTGGPAWSS